MNNAVRFVFVLYQPTDEQRRRARGIVIDNTQNNRGFGAGANEGVRRALNNGAEWIIVCNQDIVFTKKDVEILKTAFNHLEPAIAGPEVGSLDGKRWTTILPAKGPIDYVSGSCMAIHRKVVETIGYFYEPYFMYYEDADFCIRAKRAGFPLRRIALPGFVHNGGHVKQKNYYLSRNHLWFVLRNAPWNVKLHELLRLPKTLFSFIRSLLAKLQGDSLKNYDYWR